MLTMTYSSMTSFKNCPRKYWYEYVQRVRPEEQSRPLKMGSALHEGLDALYCTGSTDDAVRGVNRHYPEVETEKEYVDAISIATLVRRYPDIWKGSEIMGEEAALESSETNFSMPLMDGVQMMGKIDKQFKVPHDRLIMEHKSTSDNITDDDIWSRLFHDPQNAVYANASGIMRVVYDVVRKPTIKQKRGETPEEYGRRLDDDIDKRPQWYYGRRQKVHTEGSTRDLILSARAWAGLIMDQSETMNEFPKNEGHCLAYGKCAFWKLCFGSTYSNEVGPDHGDIDEPPDGFVKLENPHPELEIQERPYDQISPSNPASAPDAAEAADVSGDGDFPFAPGNGPGGV